MVIVCGDSMYTNGGVDDRHKGLFLDYIYSGDGMVHIGSHIPWVSVPPTAYIVRICIVFWIGLPVPFVLFADFGNLVLHTETGFLRSRYRIL
jgi:hypothetical protein